MSARQPDQSKLIVTSRPYGTIRDVFAPKLDIDSIHLKGENEAEKKEIMVEINLVTGERVKQFQDRRLRQKVDDDAHILLLNRLHEINNRTYLWVALIFPVLESNAGKFKDTILGIIKSILSLIKEAYLIL
jgi:hypothetical protein